MNHVHSKAKIRGKNTLKETTARLITQKHRQIPAKITISIPEVIKP